MTTAARTSTAKPSVRKAAVRQHISDRRYYVQCAYRVTMAVIFLVALLITHSN